MGESYQPGTWRFNLQAAGDVSVLHTNFAAAVRIPAWFEFIRHPQLLSRPCQAGFAGVWFRQEKPLRFRAGPAGAAQARPAPENRADERQTAFRLFSRLALGGVFGQQ